MTGEDRQAELMQELIENKGVDLEVDLTTLQTEQTVAGQFVRDVLVASELSTEDRAQVLIVGLRALAGHDELGVD